MYKSRKQHCVIHSKLQKDKLVEAVNATNMTVKMELC